MSRDGECVAGNFVEARLAPRSLTQATPAQHPGGGAASRRPADAVVAAQQPPQLLRSPGPVLAAFPQDQWCNPLGGLVRATVRPAAALAQSRDAILAITHHPLVTGLPADVIVRTQLREREAARGRETDESLLLFHEGYLVPGHSLKV